MGSGDLKKPAMAGREFLAVQRDDLDPPEEKPSSLWHSFLHG